MTEIIALLLTLSLATTASRDAGCGIDPNGCSGRRLAIAAADDHRAPAVTPRGMPFSDNGCSIDPNGCNPPGLSSDGGPHMDPNG
jgi:hypothetical protein